MEIERHIEVERLDARGMEIVRDRETGMDVNT